jgi:hypothetical protein
MSDSRQEVRRWQQSTLRVLPADQSFNTAYRTRSYVDLRLIVQQYLPGLEGPLKLHAVIRCQSLSVSPSSTGGHTD